MLIPHPSLNYVLDFIWNALFLVYFLQGIPGGLLCACLTDKFGMVVQLFIFEAFHLYIRVTV